MYRNSAFRINHGFNVECKLWNITITWQTIKKDAATYIEQKQAPQLFEELREISCRNDQSQNHMNQKIPGASWSVNNVVLLFLG